MSAFAKAAGQQHFLFLSGAVIRHILFKLHPFKAKLAQQRQEHRLVHARVPGVVSCAAVQK